MPVTKILIVDDSPTERHVLVELLTKNGYQVITAESGEEGIEKAMVSISNRQYRINRDNDLRVGGTLNNAIRGK